MDGHERFSYRLPDDLPPEPGWLGRPDDLIGASLGAFPAHPVFLLPGPFLPAALPPESLLPGLVLRPNSDITIRSLPAVLGD